MFQHLPENTGDAAFELILIERKSAQIASEGLGAADIAQLLLKMETSPVSKH